MMWSSIYRYRLASPSSSAPVLYGFPAGRPFRVIGRSAGFAHIQDLKSSASGWIDEAALAPTTSAPVRSAPSQPKPYSVSRIPPNPWAGPTPKVTKNDSAVTADSRAATRPSRKRRGLPHKRRFPGDVYSGESFFNARSLLSSSAQTSSGQMSPVREEAFASEIKKAETRTRRIEWGCSSLKEGKR